MIHRPARAGHPDAITLNAKVQGHKPMGARTGNGASWDTANQTLLSAAYRKLTREKKPHEGKRGVPRAQTFFPRGVEFLGYVEGQNVAIDGPTLDLARNCSISRWT